MKGEFVASTVQQPFGQQRPPARWWCINMAAPIRHPAPSRGCARRGEGPVGLRQRPAAEPSKQRSIVDVVSWKGTDWQVRPQKHRGEISLPLVSPTTSNHGMRRRRRSGSSRGFIGLLRPLRATTISSRGSDAQSLLARFSLPSVRHRRSWLSSSSSFTNAKSKQLLRWRRVVAVARAL